MVAPNTYPKRVLYYWAELHGQQMREGQPYAALEATISVSFIGNVVFPEVPEYHLDFQLRSPRHPGLVFSDQQSMHVVELGKFRRTAEELTDPLDVWCYFLVHGADLDADNLPPALQSPAVKRAMEVLLMLTQNELERQRYLDRLKAERDQFSYLHDAREDGLKEGRKEGLQQGLQQGLEQGEIVGRIHAYQRVLKLQMTPGAELMALPLAELRARAATLEQQLGAEGA
jgi:predicted transposase/invertase (TIGR01784 family)